MSSIYYITPGIIEVLIVAVVADVSVIIKIFQNVVRD
jgi:hypothetical protein